MGSRVLVLGGTAEARALADALAGRRGLTVVTSLAGCTTAPLRPAGELRRGGFGGIDGLAAWLSRHAIDAAIDATHPFAARISANAAAACARLGLPRVSLWRPEWERAPGDRWIPAPDVAAAAQAARRGRRVLLAIGRRNLAPFAACRDCQFVVRVFEDPGAALLPGAEIVVARGPFDEAAETAFLRRSAIDLVVSKNAGGSAGYGKIAAARALGLPVAMIARPPPPDPPRVASAAAAVAWLDARLG